MRRSPPRHTRLTRLLSKTNALSKARTSIYDANGNQTSVTDREGRTRTFSYDALNRQTEENWLDSTGATIRSTQSFYDPLNQLVELTDPDSSYSYSYDSQGRLQTVSNFGTPGVPTVLFTYGYDNNGNVTAVTEAINGVTTSTTTYTYNSLNQVHPIARLGNGMQDKRVDFAYNSIGQVTSMKRYSNLIGTQLVAETVNTYDPLNRLAGINHKRSNGTSINNYTFGYDADGRIVLITDVDGSTTYSYDRSDELTGADRPGTTQDEAYSYDANGNRTNNGSVTGANNRLQTDGIYTYSYDDEGNLLSRTTIATGAVREYTWDYRNRLVGVTDRAGTTTTRQTTYTYDVTNQRIAKTVDLDGQGANPATTTRFVYDRNNVAMEFTGSATVPSTRYFHGTNVDQVLAQESSNTTTWLLSDQVGTTRDLVNNSGTLLNHFTYDSFGNQTGSTPNATVDTRYKFTGREFDGETGDYFYRSRYYDPEVGRFLGEDAIGFGGGDANLYRYVGNQPIMLTDPSGEEPYVGVLAGRDYSREITYADINNATKTTFSTRDLLPIFQPRRIYKDEFAAEFRHQEGDEYVKYPNPQDIIGIQSIGNTAKDDRGHILPFFLGANGFAQGSTANSDNFFWQNRKINRSTYSDFGQEIGAMLLRYHNRGQCYPAFWMRYEVEFTYGNNLNPLRPTQFEVTVKGIWRQSSPNLPPLFGDLFPVTSSRVMRRRTFDNPPTP
jgi:RHS repeat-associated protein